MVQVLALILYGSSPIALILYGSSPIALILYGSSPSPITVGLILYFPPNFKFYSTWKLLLIKTLFDPVN